MGTYIKQLRAHEKNLLKKRIRKKGMTITVSGLSGSGKSLIGESIAKAFNLRYVSMGDIFRELAKDKGMNIEEFDKIRKKDVDLMLDKKTLELAMKGNILIVARIAGWVSGDYADFKVWVDCDYGTRAKRTAAREKISLRQAKKYLDERDNANTRRYKKLYNLNQNDLSIYDIIFDNNRLSKEAAKRLPVIVVGRELRKRGVLK